MSGEDVAFSVLMVCTGNICRSPTAEIVLRHKLGEAGLGERVRVASAGTHDYHVGSPADERSTEHARLRGYDLSAHCARQVRPLDFERFDLILAMDHGHMELLQDACPPEHGDKLRRMMEFAPAGLPDEVADPYYGGRQGSKGSSTTSRLPATGWWSTSAPRCCTAEKPEYPSSELGFRVYLTETVRNPRESQQLPARGNAGRGPARKPEHGWRRPVGQGARQARNSKPA